jgi:hypothetical protein
MKSASVPTESGVDKPETRSPPPASRIRSSEAARQLAHARLQASPRNAE